MLLKFLFSAIFLSLAVQNVNCHNFLLVSPTFGYSHMKFISKIADTLADGGHNVTLLQVYVYEHFGIIRMNKNKNVEIIDYHDEENAFSNEQSASAFDFMWTSDMVSSPLTAAFVPAMVLYPEFEQMCKKVLNDKKLHELILSKKFDGFISETFDFCGLFLGDHLKQNLIPVFSAMKSLTAAKVVGEPSPLNYLPAAHSNYGEKQTIFDRVRDVISITSFYYAFARLFDRQYAQATEILKGDVRPWEEILSTSTFYLTNSNPYLSFPSPTIPKVVQIGGFTIDPPKNLELPEEYDEILNRRKSNILISFGTVVQSMDMPENFRTGLIEMFHKMPETTFIWKYEQDDENLKKRLPENVVQMKWVPQPALLADPRLDVFVTHGGLGSTLEVAYAGKPALLIPIFGDQLINAELLARHNGSIVYSKYDLVNSEKLTAALEEVISNEDYNKNAILLSNILKNQPVDPKETLLRHCEFAAKFGRVRAFEPYNLKYGFIQYYLLDAFAIIFTVVGLFVYISYRITRAIVFRLFLSKKTKKD